MADDFTVRYRDLLAGSYDCVDRIVLNGYYPPGPGLGEGEWRPGVPDRKAGQRRHQIAEEYLASHVVEPGVFLVLVARARAMVWKVKRSPGCAAGWCGWPDSRSTLTGPARISM